MSNEPINQLAVVTFPKASDQLATFLGIEKGMMLETLKAQCFKNKRPDEVSDAQLAAFISTANALQVNPLLPGFLYAYPERNGGITPILGPDGVMKKLDEMIVAGKLKGYKCDVKMGTDGKPESATAIIHRAEGQIPAEYTAYYSEWSVTSNPNWQARPRHMIWVRAIKQAARQVIHGLPMDADEYEIAQMQNVTGTADTPAPDRPAPKPRSPKGAAVVKENAAAKPAEVVVEAETVATTGTPPPQPEPATSANPLHAEGEKIIAEANAKVESFAQAAKATATAPKPASPARTQLNAGEVITVEAQVEEFATHPGIKDGKEIKYVKARITSPQYAGEVSDLTCSQSWTVDDPVRLTLRGNGKRVFVDKVFPLTEAAADTQPAADEF